MAFVRILSAAVLVVCLSCAPVRKPINETPLNTVCPRNISWKSVQNAPLDSFANDPLLRSRYSLNSLHIANAYGLVDELRELETIRQAADGPDSRVDLLVAERAVDDVLDLAYLGLETLIDLIDCHRLQLSKVRTRLAEQNSTQDRTLTRAAITTGAVSAVLVAGILISGDSQANEGDAKDWVGVVGGVAAAGLAIRSSRVNRTVMIRHDENLLEAIWSGENRRGVFPDSVWYVMNAVGDSAPSGLSTREQILQAWNDSPVMLADEKNLARLPVLLEPSGTYDMSMLLLRIDMLEEIGEGIDRIKYALFHLVDELNR